MMPTPPPIAPPRASHSRWRIVATVLLYFYGGLAVLDSAASLFMLLGGCGVLIGHRRLASDVQIGFIMFGAVLLGVHGCFAIALGRYVWKQHWRRSVAVVAGAIVLAIMVYMTGFIVDRLPPGEQFPPPSEMTTHN